MREMLIEKIVARLKTDAKNLSTQYQASASAKMGTHYVAVDNLLPEPLALEIYQAFPKQQEDWRKMSSMRERKSTTKNFDQLPAILKEISFAFQAPAVVDAVAEITGQKQTMPDPTYYAGGLSMMCQGDFLNPHIDNSHDGERKVYRRLNLLYYVTPDWKVENGGNLELWDTNVREPVTIESRFNRLVLMETNKLSWHSVSPVRVHGQRCCVSNYYFSHINPYETDEQYFHITAFNARPEQPFLRAVCKLDNNARMFVRKFVHLGLGKKDIYQTSDK